MTIFMTEDNYKFLREKAHESGQTFSFVYNFMIEYCMKSFLEIPEKPSFAQKIRTKRMNKRKRIYEIIDEVYYDKQ